MADFKVVLPTTTEEWQMDMRIAYNRALEDAENRYKEWSKSEYGKIVSEKVVSDDALPIRVLRSLRK